MANEKKVILQDDNLVISKTQVYYITHRWIYPTTLSVYSLMMLWRLQDNGSAIGFFMNISMSVYQIILPCKANSFKYIHRRSFYLRNINTMENEQNVQQSVIYITNSCFKLLPGNTEFIVNECIKHIRSVECWTIKIDIFLFF